MSKTPRALLDRLTEAGSTGLDLSPGDPLCREAAFELHRTREALREALQFWSDGVKLVRMIAPGDLQYKVSIQEERIAALRKEFDL